ncbi:MAG: HEAT repeat domain-containing protein [Planctomycetota bacterium]|jgi:hypothetical protein
MRYVLVLLLATIAVAEEPTYKQKIAALQSALKNKKTSPDDVTEAIDAVSDGYLEATDAEKKLGVKAIGKASKSRNIEVRHGSFEALALMRAPGSGKYLKPYLNPPEKGKISPTHLEAIKTARELGDKSILSNLIRLSNHKNLEIAMESTAAFGGYTRVSPKDRKKLAFRLVKRLNKLSRGGSAGRMGRKAGESTSGAGNASEEAAGVTPDKDDETDGHDGETGPSSAAESRRSGLYGATLQALRDLTGLKHREVGDWLQWQVSAAKVDDPFK